MCIVLDACFINVRVSIQMTGNFCALFSLLVFNLLQILNTEC